jgi:hypothetical protein
MSRQQSIMLVLLGRDQQVCDYAVALAYHLCLKDGNIKSSLQANISMSFESVGSRSRWTKIKHASREAYR